MDLPRPNFQSLPNDSFSVLKPSPQGHVQPRGDVEAFSRHLAEVRRDNAAQNRIPAKRQPNPRDTLSEKRRDEAIDTRRKTEIRDRADARQTHREAERAEQISEDKEPNADPVDDTSPDETNAAAPLPQVEAEQTGTLQINPETAPAGDHLPEPGEPGEPDLTPALQASATPGTPTGTPATETAEPTVGPKGASHKDQASATGGTKGQDIAQLANITAQDRTEGAHAAANPHRAIQSPLQRATGEPAGQTGETPALKDLATQTAAHKPASPGDADGEPLPDRTQSKSLGHEAAEKLAQRKQNHDTPAATTSPAKSAPPQAAVTTRPAPAPQDHAAFGLRAVNDLAALSLNGDQSGNASGSLPAITQTSTQNSNPLLARFGALPGHAQAAQVPVTSIAVHMARNLQNGINRFEIRIDPPELGRIDVRMELGKDGKVTAHMTVERTETLDLLQRDARLLERALQHSGLNADEDSLNFSLRDDGSHQQQAEFAKNAGERFGGSVNPTESPQDDQPLHTTTLTLTGDGRVDIRV